MKRMIALPTLRRLRPLVPFFMALPLVLAGCSIPDMRQDDDRRLMELSHGQDSLDQFSLLDGVSHLNKGKALLAGAGGSLHDLYFARSAFERAAVLQVDDPTPYYLAGYTNYRLGNYDASYRAFLNAARLDQSSDGWWMAALAALRSHHELLAQALYDKGEQARPGQSKTLSGYMRDLYSKDSNTKIVARGGNDAELPVFACEGPDDEAEGLAGICESDLQVEIFIVTRETEAGSSLGQDLMADLSIGIGGKPFDFERTRTSSSTRADGDATSAIDTEDSVSKYNGITVDLPSVNYALSIASDAEAVSTISSTPILKVALGQEAKLTVGNNLQISAVNGDSGSDVEADVGVIIELELTKFTGSNATLKAVAEISDFLPPVIGANFTKVEIDTSRIESGGQVPYNTAFLLGSLEMTSREDARGGQKGLRQIPVVGNLFGTRATWVTTHEVAILLTARPPQGIEKAQEVQFLDDLRGLAIPLPTVARRSSIVHKSPSMGVVIAEMGLLQ